MSVSGTLHPWFPERLRVLGRHEEAEPLNRELFEEGARAWGAGGRESWVLHFPFRKKKK